MLEVRAATLELRLSRDIRKKRKTTRAKAYLTPPGKSVRSPAQPLPTCLLCRQGTSLRHESQPLTDLPASTLVSSAHSPQQERHKQSCYPSITVMQWLPVARGTNSNSSAGSARLPESGSSPLRNPSRHAPSHPRPPLLFLQPHWGPSHLPLPLLEHSPQLWAQLARLRPLELSSTVSSSERLLLTTPSRCPRLVHHPVSPSARITLGMCVFTCVSLLREQGVP